MLPQIRTENKKKIITNITLIFIKMTTNFITLKKKNSQNLEIRCVHRVRIKKKMLERMVGVY